MIFSGPQEMYNCYNTIGSQLYNFSFLDAYRVGMVYPQDRHYVLFTEHWEWSTRIAISLRLKRVTMYDTVALISENHMNNTLILSGVLYSGAKFMPLDPNCDSGELRRILRLISPKVIFCSPDQYDRVKKFAPRSSTLEICSHNSPEFMSYVGVGKNEQIIRFRPSHQNPQNTAVILVTSGTTGRPKLVKIKHHTLIRMCFYGKSQSYFGINKKDKIINPFPMYTINGFLLHIACLFGKCQSIVLKSFEPELFLNYCVEFRVTKMFLLPHMAEILTTDHLNDLKYCFEHIKYFFICGDHMKEVVYRELLKNIDVVPRRIYWATEGFFAMQRPNQPFKEGSVGPLMPGLRAKVISVTTGKELGHNQRGELYVRGRLVTKGYYGQQKKVYFDDDGFFRTGDYGYFDIHNNFYALDRVEDLIRYENILVSPTEIESIILECCGVTDCGVISVKNEEHGNVPLAFVSTEDDCTLTPDDIIKFVEESTGLQVQFHLIGGCKIVSGIPRASDGKLLRRILRLML